MATPASGAVHDVVVVGAGSAGAIVAARVSEDPQCRVLLIDAGPALASLRLRMPSGRGIPEHGGPDDWGLSSTKQMQLFGRILDLPRGRMLGGSSGLGDMTYMRGHPLDFERWAEQGAVGWSHPEVLPYFKRIERFADGGDLYRGGDGPVAIAHCPPRDHLSLAFLQAGSELGYSMTDDPAGERQEGFFLADLAIDQGVRGSTAHAYLAAVRHRPNLSIRHGTRVLGIAIERGRAIGVQAAAWEGGPVELVHAEHEVVLAAGAVSTPQLLMLSGIGPADHLRSHGVRTVLDLPGVGANLQDHVRLEHVHVVAEPVSLAGELARSRSLIGKLRWATLGTGPSATAECTVGAIVKTADYADHGDMQISLRPYMLSGNGEPMSEHGMIPSIMMLRPKSRGSVRLASSEPRAAPLVDPNYLAEPDDLLDMRHGFDVLRNIMAAEAFADFGVFELDPGTEVTSRRQIEEYLKVNAESGYDLAGTCRMGSDEHAVTTGDGLVRGIAGLRVADASLMPSLTSGGTNAPVMMIGERIADLVRGRKPLRPLRLPYYADGVKYGIGLEPKREPGSRSAEPP